MAAAFLLMGMVVASYGPLLEHLSRRFGVSLPVAGTTISVYFAGSLPGVFIAKWLFERLRAQHIVTLAFAVSGAGLIAAALASSWSFYLSAVFLVGLGFGALVLGLNQLVAYSESRRRTALLNALNSCYSAGAVAGPILVAAFAQGHFPVLYLGAAVLMVLLIPGTAGISGKLPASVGSPMRPHGLVGIFVIAFVLYVAVENGAGGWMTSHLVSVGLAFNDAAAVTSGFWLALVTGRLLIALVPSRVSESAIVLTCSALATIALFAASIGALAPFAFLAAGLAIAPIFPTGIVWLAGLRPDDSRATSWLYPAASIGGTLGPGVIGLVIAHAGVGWAPAMLGLVALAMFVAFLAASHQAGARRAPSAGSIHSVARGADHHRAVATEKNVAEPPQ